MGTTLSTTVPWDPLDMDRHKDGAFSLSTSSLTSVAAGAPAAAAGLIMGQNAPPLYEHALVGDWSSLLQRIATHPQEALYKDKCQNLALHVSCRRQPPPRVVDALIQANPDSVDATTMDGLTPLHFGCFCGSSPETIELVMGEVRSLRDLVDRRGRTPLHCVCAGFRSPHRSAVVRMLLELDPYCAMACDEKGRTPLSLIFEDYAEEFQEYLSEKDSAEASASIEEGGDLYECWQVVTLILRAAYRGTVEEDSKSNEVSVEGTFRLLHAAVGVGGCPAVIVKFLLKIDPGAVSQKDGDLLLPLHVACKTVGQRWSRKVTQYTKGQLHNTDFEQDLPQEDVIAEILQAYPGAAAEEDENGKLPIVLAMENGKPWKTSLEPMWNEHQVDDFGLLQDAIDKGLTSALNCVRNETVKTMAFVAPRWPGEEADAWVNHVIEFSREAPLTKDEAWYGTMQSSTLDGLAAILQNVQKSSLNVPTTPQHALDVVLPMLNHAEEQVRVSAARVFGSAVALMKPALIEKTLTDVVFPPENDKPSDDSMSTMGHSCADTSLECVHGRAMACHFALKHQPRELTTEQTQIVRGWMKHETVTVRKAACLAVGSILRSSNDLKEYKSILLKCMRATEDASVHFNLAKALAQAARQHEKLFLCKAGLPLLDGALMLSAMSGRTPHAVQHALHTFLWYALQKNESGLHEYMSMAEGENGRIMMSLVNRTLAKLPIVEEGEDKVDGH